MAYVWGPAPRDGYLAVQVCPLTKDWDTYLLLLDTGGGVIDKNDNATTHGCIGSATRSAPDVSRLGAPSARNDPLLRQRARAAPLPPPPAHTPCMHARTPTLVRTSQNVGHCRRCAHHLD